MIYIFFILLRASIGDAHVFIFEHMKIDRNKAIIFYA